MNLIIIKMKAIIATTTAPYTLLIVKQFRAEVHFDPIRLHRNHAISHKDYYNGGYSQPNQKESFL